MTTRDDMDEINHFGTKVTKKQLFRIVDPSTDNSVKQVLLFFDDIIGFFVHIFKRIVGNEILTKFLDSTNFQDPLRTFHDRIPDD